MFEMFFFLRKCKYRQYLRDNAGSVPTHHNKVNITIKQLTQAGIKIAGRTISNLRYEDDTTLMAESEEELNSLLRRVKEESEEAGLKTQHSKN